MKFKQFIKDNIKRISSVILCIVLMFSMTITALAFDGESISPIDKEVLDEYLSSAEVLYNSSGHPIYSPLNLDVLYWTMKIPIVSEGWECSEYEYFALTTGGRNDVASSTTYYIIPERWTSGLLNFTLTLVANGDAGMPGVYNLGLNNASLTEVDGNSSATTTSGIYYKALSVGSWNFGAFSDEGMFDYSTYIKAYVYSVSRSPNGTITNVSELYYGYYSDLSKSVLPTSNITQIYFHSSCEHKFETYVSNGLNYNNVLSYEGNVSTVNSNYSVSTSTYSITAYDYFNDVENLESFQSGMNIIFFSGSNGRTISSDYIPECLRGSAWSSGKTLTFNPDDEYSVYTDNFMVDNIPFLFFPYYDSTASQGYYIFVFEEDTKPITYYRVVNQGLSTMIQVICKVDYDVYYQGSLVGHYSSEETTYTANSVHKVYKGKTIDTIFSEGESSSCYPYFFHWKTTGSISNAKPNFHLEYFYGQSTTFSIFPNESGSLGFYTYVSPDIFEIVIGEGGSDIGSGSNGSGGSGPDIWFDDSSFFTELNQSEVFDLGLPPYPDASGIFDVDISDIWLIPERIVEYLIVVIDWVATSFEIFIDKVGGPIEKFFLIMRVIFEKMPEVLRFAFILVIFTLLGLRLLQYSSTSINMVSGTVSSSYSRISRNKRKNKTKEKNKKGGDD